MSFRKRQRLPRRSRRPTIPSSGRIRLPEKMPGQEEPPQGAIPDGVTEAEPEREEEPGRILEREEEQLRIPEQEEEPGPIPEREEERLRIPEQEGERPPIPEREEERLPIPEQEGERPPILEQEEERLPILEREGNDYRSRNRGRNSHRSWNGRRNGHRSRNRRHSRNRDGVERRNLIEKAIPYKSYRDGFFKTKKRKVWMKR